MTTRVQSHPTQGKGQKRTPTILATRYFTRKGLHPFDAVEWETTDVKITKPDGTVVFEQKDVEKPSFWSERAIQIVAQKYFRVPAKLGRRERSVKELIGRVVDTITEWGWKDGYFNDADERETFRAELAYILLHQRAAFNSPVWFNVGVEEKSQCSACFILSVEDTMPSILEWCTTEGMIFKGGSGAGINLSSLRSSKEPLSKGGVASGPVSFMKGADAIAGMIRSGGATRRAAKMVVLNIDHPDIKDFIMCKVEAERMLHALVEQGFDSSLEGKLFSPYTCIPYQNANNSVRVTDAFMRAVEADGMWQLRAVKTGEVLEEVRARDLFNMIAEAAWQCADPGMQYDTIINEWHTIPQSGRINASNPCSEYMSIDNSACNLASINLLKYLKADRTFDIDAFRHTVRTLILAQDIIVDNSSYPTPKITANAKAFRQLGLGYANLGALLMVCGLPYDSNEGRAMAGAITALMTGEAYRMSGFIAKKLGPYEGFELNKEDHIRVMKQHRDALTDPSRHPANYKIQHAVCDDIYRAAVSSWNHAIQLAEQYGHRNSQATVIAPTGCLIGNSLIITDRGLVRLRTLGNPGGEKWQDVSFQVLTDQGVQHATKFFINGREKTRKIRTESGYEIQGTLKHKIRVVELQTGRFVWKKFSEIRKGDVVPLAMGQLVGEPRNVELPPLGDLHWNADFSTKVPRQMTEDLAMLVGYFMGDGSLHAKGLRFCVTKEDEDVVEWLKTLAQNLFGIEAKTSEREGYIEVSMHSVPLAIWWEACGFAKKLPTLPHKGKGYEPHIPDAILTTNNKKIYGAFLRGLFEADGTITQDVPSLTSACAEFVQEVKTLLLVLGFPTTTKVDRAFRLGRYEILSLRLKNYTYNKKFMDEIGFIGIRKRASVLIAEGMEQGKRDRLYGDANYIRELVPVGSGQRNAVLLSLNREGMITRHQGKILYEQTHDAYLEQAMKFFYDKVIINEDGGEELTYDLSVPANVTYVANGFISHNTISFMMDCETTGIEPELFLVKTKDLVGGGTITVENRLVGKALGTLGYSENQIASILAYLREWGTIEGAPALREEHLPVFDCAIKAPNGTRFLSPMAHITMMAAVQPFISGAISKTVNVPNDATKEDFATLFFEGWRLGLKALALYREGSKAMTIYRSGGKKKDEELQAQAAPQTSEFHEGEGGEKQKRLHVPSDEHDEMESEHRAIVKPFKVATTKGRLIVGVDSQGYAKEIYIEAAKVGSAVSGYLKSIGIAVSKGLRAGVPLKVYVDALSGISFEPSGFTNDPEEPVASSIISYCMRWMAKRFPLNGEPAESDLWGNLGSYEKVEKKEDAPASESKMIAKEEKPLLEADSRIESGAQMTFRSGVVQDRNKTSAAEIDSGMKETQSEKVEATLASSWDREYTFFCSDCGNFMKPTGTNCFTCTTCGTNTGCG